ncbi:O-antigen ligase [Clostridium acetobutylicum]|uniref:Uncharacterized conserved membrane protein n=2 Tax=Bacteria TaxID=2 RepID=Q97E23_CLOAB|nr:MULTISPECIES: O-antigen ligase family protein [Clostridium]AAK81227.1 Uncharacterized conserved membrane protein [Clostridium acetobutylicum ATCC 824]ADZ22332.1 Conserved hypothetical protein [Clostridium acetobutylicum EA 2018]AEI32751.1 hypothetical protein SMB_G3329 [Clostridium acetobutylicum DSM 1731]AWV81105.1 O-antigen ligase domain-containing protein [Clostridium acetobutylicum]MBC2395694.1 O-antigen ligase family protein [Clostridium acetobutylicum]
MTNGKVVNLDSSRKFRDYDKFIILMLSLVIFLVPLVVFLKPIKIDSELLRSLTGLQYNFDFFSYYKMIVFIIISLVMLLYFLYKLIRKEIILESTKFYIPIIIYGAFIIISTILSQHKDIALFGYLERYEGMIVLIFYLLNLLIVINSVSNDRSLKIIIISLMSSAFIICIIGISQILGHDFYQSYFGRRVILPGEYKAYADGLSFSFPKGTVYGTLYNPDYVGSYMGMIVGLAFILCLCLKNKKYKAVTGIIGTLAFINIIGSNSRAGLVGVVVALITAVVFIRKKIKKNILVGIIPLILIVIIFGALSTKGSTAIINKFKTTASEVTKICKGSEYEKQSIGSGRGYIWGKSIKLLEDTVIMGYGPDNFAAFFPKNDPARKVLKGVIIDKPHNMYLQIAINTGSISLMAVLALFIMYIITSFKLYFRAEMDNLYNIFGLGIFIAFLSYTVTAFFNDSVISVAPVFWILLGMGISINITLKADRDKL